MTLSYEQRERYACKVCGSVPDEAGFVEHGRGCFTQDEDGGGTSYVEFDDQTEYTREELLEEIAELRREFHEDLIEERKRLVRSLTKVIDDLRDAQTTDERS